MVHPSQWLHQFELLRPFTTEEAWLLFRLAAFGEAIGWTLLIAGILCKHFVLPGNNLPVLLAGQVHGMLFMLYGLAALGLYPSLNWSRTRAVLALAASVPPYGSLLFEQWEARRRYGIAAQSFGQFLICLVLWTQIPETIR